MPFHAGYLNHKKDYSANIMKSFYCIYGIGSDTWKQVTVDAQNQHMFDFKEVSVDKNDDGTVHKLSFRVKANSYLKDKKHLIEIGGQHVQMSNHGRV